MAQQLLINYLRTDKTKNRIRALLRRNITLGETQKNIHLHQLENTGDPKLSNHGCYTSAQTKDKKQFINDFERKNRNLKTITVVHNNKKYIIYYGISGHDSRLSHNTRDSRLTHSSRKRCFSNMDYYLTWYFCGNLTEIECLYVESNLSLYNHQEELDSDCFNKIQSTLVFATIDVELVKICLFLMSQKIVEGVEVFGLRFKPNNERYAVSMDALISELKGQPDVVNIVDETPVLEPLPMNDKPVLDPFSMVVKLREHSVNDFGEQFEILDNLFDRNSLKGVKFVVSNDQFVALIKHFNCSKSYFVRCNKAYTHLFNKKFDGVLEKIQAKNTKTPLWTSIAKFFNSGETTEFLNNEFSELSFGCLLYLLYLKANLFCYNNKTFTVDGTLVANLRYGRYQNDVLQTAHCDDAKCDLAFQVTSLKQFIIKSSIEEHSIEFGYIVQPRAIGKSAKEYCVQKLHRGDNCSSLNINGFGFRE